MKLDFTGRTVIVTGGGTGIGRALSIAFGAAGANVVVNYSRSENEANETVAEIESGPGRALACRADVRVWDDVRAMVDLAIGEFGGLDVLVNNAGNVNQPKLPVAELSLDVWNDTLELNLTSVFLCCKAAIPHLSDQDGRIISITSMSGHTGGGVGGSPYGAAKAGVITMTRCMARELAPRGITVNTVAPGIIDTRIHHRYTPPEQYRQLIDLIPLGHDGKPEDIAGITLLLASPAGGFITGETVHVNGGHLML
ncbi:MAG: oxidoreductase [Phycisphaeraceae bacterium]|nr:oxidoreductase [Phycisphaeraceae bacterium]